MRKLSTSQSDVITEVYSYDTQEELNKHFEEMQQSGWIGSDVGNSFNNFMTTYTKRSVNVDG